MLLEIVAIACEKNRYFLKMRRLVTSGDLNDLCKILKFRCGLSYFWRGFLKPPPQTEPFIARQEWA